MSLRERMAGPDSDARQRRTYRQYGVLDNPFPSAGHTTRHPRQEDVVDEALLDLFAQFEEGARLSQVVTIVGPPGAGKANLLDYYEGQFRDYYRGRDACYVIRRHPAPSFDSLLRTILQSFGPRHLENIGRTLAQGSDTARTAAKERARSHDVRIVLDRLARAGGSDGRLADCARLAFEWFLGLSVSKRHRTVLGVSFRLDTVESRMQALRDLIYVSERLRLLEGIVLLIDELEKHDYSLSKTLALRFLLSIRALIDGLPERLFLMLAMTSQARTRYLAMLPALASRLQDTIVLPPLRDEGEANRLFEFYVANERDAAGSSQRARGEKQGAAELFGAEELTDMFRGLRERSERQGNEGVTPRDYLHHLHEEWENRVRAG